jgi:uncharacterized repeat protein (TIGR01451 family)
MNNKKIIPLVLAVILTISIFTPSISSERQTKDTDSLYCGQIEILYNILSNIAENFPIIKELRIVQSIFDAHTKCSCNPEIEVIKEADINEAYVGDTITYTYTVTNTGGQELTDIYVEDDLLGSVPLGTTTLQPKEHTTGTLTYTIQESDLPGPIFNMALANGSYCCGYVEDTDCEFVEILIQEPPVNEIQMEKTADKDVVEVGELVTYSYVVTNVGEDWLSDVTVVDDLLGPVELNSTVLAPGDWANGTLTYVVQESDLPGPIVNTAIANGSTCQCSYVEDSDNETVSILSVEPEIELEKKADKTIATVGDLIVYSYFVTNTGNVNLHNIKVKDDLLGEVTLKQDHLAPDEWTWGMLPYFVEKKDLPGPIVNIAVVTAQTINEEEVEDTDEASVELDMPCAPEVWVKYLWFSQADVNKYNSDLIYGYDAFRTIQDAVDAVCECGTIHVLSGSYHGQILIDKSLELLGEPGAEILPSALDTFTIDGSTETYKPMIFAYSGTLNGKNVISNGMISVKIDGFEIRGYYNTAIHFHNVGAGCIDSIISHNRIKAEVCVQITGSSSYDPSGLKIHYNYFGFDQCKLHIGVWNKFNGIVDARYNWWDEDAGPSSPKGTTTYDAVTERPADSYLGDKVIGKVNFDPWWGIDAYPKVTQNTRYPTTYHFKARSFAFDETGDITTKIEYKWYFGDGFYKIAPHSRGGYVAAHNYSSPGYYNGYLTVTVTSYDINGVIGYLRESDAFTVTVP